MEIVKEQVDSLNAVLTLKVKQQDYKDKVKDILKTYKKKVHIPGFRAGMVPMGMLNKMYGESVRADEINKLLNDALHKYISENKIEILGNPIPKESEKEVSFKNDIDFDFDFELGISPEFSVDISSKQKFTKYIVSVDQKLKDKNLDDLKKRFGDLKVSDTVGEKDMVSIKIIPLGKEEQSAKTTSIFTEYVESKKELNKILGKKVGDTLELNLKKMAKNDQDFASMVGVLKEKVSSVEQVYTTEILEIKTIIPAEENQAFYDKIFGPGKINSKQEFNEKTNQELENLMHSFSNRKLKKDVMDFYLKKLKLPLPDDFLKKWLQKTNTNLSASQISEDYDKFSKDMRWMLVENKIVKENNLEITPEELKNKASDQVSNYFANYGLPVPEKEQLEAYVQQILSNQEEQNKLRGELIDKKLLNLFNEKLTLKEKNVSYSEFEDILQEKTSRFNIFKKFKF